MVVPARDEQELLPACLAALERAAGRTRIPVTVVVVLDACSDASAEVVAAARLPRLQRVVMIGSDRGNVGYARDLGVRALLADYGAAGLWLANTDADSTVPPLWFRRQLNHAERGAAAVAGTVVVTDWSGHSTRTRRHYLRRYTAGHGHRHTHGANLSMSATAYLATGGFAHLAADEDVAMIGQLIAAGQPIAWAADLPVSTSARLAGRTPAGFAGHLRLITQPPSAGPSPVPAGHQNRAADSDTPAREGAL